MVVQLVEVQSAVSVEQFQAELVQLLATELGGYQTRRLGLTLGTLFGSLRQNALQTYALCFLDP